MNLYRRQTERRGAIVPLFAILLIPILAMLCFSIDAGWMVLTRTDLKITHGGNAGLARPASYAGIVHFDDFTVTHAGTPVPHPSAIPQTAHRPTPRVRQHHAVGAIDRQRVAAYCVAIGIELAHFGQRGE